MKPHLLKNRGVWYCALPGPFVSARVIGDGYTPLEAFKDWQIKSEQRSSRASRETNRLMNGFQLRERYHRPR